MNPFQGANNWYWPDYWLAVTGSAFVLVLGAYITAKLELSWVVLFGGLVLFGIGGKIAHHRERDRALRTNVWVSKWRHSLLGDTFALVGILLATSAVVVP